MTETAHTGEYVIAVDLGAESGRVLRVGFDGVRFSIDLASRFPNVPVTARGTLYWDVLRLWGDIQQGIEAALAAGQPLGIGVDTWGVDFALLDRVGGLLANPVHYRDARTDGMMDWVFERVPRRTIFERTGIQFIFLNTLYQLASLVASGSPLLDSADQYLAMPDLLNYWLTGVRVNEFTHATTTQLLSPVTGTWDSETMRAVGIPTAWFSAPLAQPGTILGSYRETPVILPAAHDTGSAVVGVPATTRDYAYISSGTWSLIGLELDAPVLSQAAYEANLTNEGGVYGTWRLLKNVAGMWLVQQCRATWAAQGEQYAYDTLASLAMQAVPFAAVIDPDDPSFVAPGDMPARIAAYCARTQQAVPQGAGGMMRTIYESLALKYRLVIEQLSAISGQRIERVHVIGGGSQNALLCQMTADAVRRPVVAGPSEATAIGNAIVQLIALGKIGSLAEARAALAASQALVTYEPRHAATWDDAYQRFRGVLAQ